MRRLFAPRWQGIRNAWVRADRGRKVTYLVFGGLTLGFWAGVFAVCLYFMRMFNGVEMFGPLLLRKALSMLLVSFSGLLLFSNIITALSDQAHRARMITLRIRGTPVQSTEDHRQILACLRTGDAEGARRVFRAHRQRVAQELLTILDTYKLGQL